MNFWIMLWKVVFILGLTSFTGMAIWVTFGGYFDIRRLFKSIGGQSPESAKDITEPKS